MTSIINAVVSEIEILRKDFDAKMELQKIEEHEDFRQRRAIEIDLLSIQINELRQFCAIHVHILKITKAKSSRDIIIANENINQLMLNFETQFNRFSQQFN